MNSAPKKYQKGSFHKMTADLKMMLTASLEAQEAWKDITPLARNEWICWITSGKKAETRVIRIEKARSMLKEGKRRPCCWPGCPHR